ncbi:protein NCBP2AS2 [Bombina bombina]|uniref:protein NCBP2AS2 n=1 Tax=Bombina bombina TaxID=8345 RepID=UPI00235A960F|nr:protein NCBP2AS2 [Bombina bombina]
MVIRRILFNLLNNPQVIEKLAESRPIRRAAQITVFALNKAQMTGEQTAERLLRSDTLRQVREAAAGSSAPRNLQEATRRARRIRDSFIKEMRTGIQDVKGKIKRGDRE